VLAITEAVGVWRFQIHPEVWLLLGGLTVLYVYAARVVGPKVVPAGQPVLTRRNKVCAVVGLILLWVASDWPMHDIGEQYLYAIHMVQHTLLTLVIPPLALLATPRWLADLILGRGKVRTVIRALSLPVVAGVAYNAMVIASHWPALVNASVENGIIHYLVHVVLVFTAVMMWMPLCGPIEEWRMGIPGKMIYLFCMSVVPTVPGGWLTFAENAVYSAYDTPTRAFGISVQDDQQAAGVFMKLFAGSWLWFLITCQFFVWAFRHQREEAELDRAARPVPAPSASSSSSSEDEPSDDEPLTYEAVAEAFAATAPAPEPDSRTP
jgi:putative membrane protein